MLEILRSSFESGFGELENFRFTIGNPVFWVFFLLLFVILVRWFWNPKKSLSLCIVLAIVFLSATKLEEMLGLAISDADGHFDPSLFRFLIALIILIVIGYYALVKGDE